MIAQVAASLDPLTQTVPGLQITAFMNAAPTPPSIDIYPADVSGVKVAQNDWDETVTVRARVTAPDNIGAQQVLLTLMELSGPTSVSAALETDPRFFVDERSGYRPYGDLLGCEWTVRW
jgi:hypothetical protein